MEGAGEDEVPFLSCRGLFKRTATAAGEGRPSCYKGQGTDWPGLVAAARRVRALTADVAAI